MTKLVVDCGNCGPDYNSIRKLIKSSFDAKVIQTHGSQDTLEVLRNREVALVTVNRKLDRDYTDGLEVIRTIKADPEVGAVPVMLVTNYDEHQASATELGALPGFGKLSLDDPETHARLQAVLGD
jgi:CheY-like chemotaxis protein